MKEKVNAYTKLVFKSLGDLTSAQKEAGEAGIHFNVVERSGEIVAEIPADKVLFFKGLGSINFGISVREH